MKWLRTWKNGGLWAQHRLITYTPGIVICDIQAFCSCWTVSSLDDMVFTVLLLLGTEKFYKDSFPLNTKVLFLRVQTPHDVSQTWLLPSDRSSIDKLGMVTKERRTRRFVTMSVKVQSVRVSKHSIKEYGCRGSKSPIILDADDWSGWGKARGRMWQATNGNGTQNMLSGAPHTVQLAPMNILTSLLYQTHTQS
jgi:hypothetical protein